MEMTPLKLPSVIKSVFDRISVLISPCSAAVRLLLLLSPTAAVVVVVVESCYHRHTQVAASDMTFLYSLSNVVIIIVCVNHILMVSSFYVRGSRQSWRHGHFCMKMC